jgi:hypothetical protein
MDQDANAGGLGPVRRAARFPLRTQAGLNARDSSSANWMRSRSITLMIFLICASSSEQLAAQEATRQQVTLEASTLAAALGYGRVTSPAHLIGIGAGAGYELNIRLVHGEPRGRKSAEVGHLELFERLKPPGPWQFDLGIKAALDFHAAQVASEAEPGGFFGGYIAPMWGGRHVRIGPRVQAGTYWSSSRPSFGLSITPLTARLLFDF